MEPPVLTTHISVLLNETIEALQARPGGSYIDCTLGAGGHASAILEHSIPNGRLLGIDADSTAIELVKERLKAYGDRVVLANSNFSGLAEVAHRFGFQPVDGILLDLGFSSVQIEKEDRGFSFQRDGPLDMRYDTSQDLTAADLVNDLSEEELAHLLYEYGEEPHARRIARAIVASRPITRTTQLATVITRTVRKSHDRIHPATRTFQALRIAVNRELENLATALEQTISLLKSGGRLVVIAFHSLEDRLVKNFLRREAKGCICPPNAPVCVCGHVPTLRQVNKKVITPGPDEIAANPRARSARMRVAERL